MLYLVHNVTYNPIMLSYFPGSFLFFLFPFVWSLTFGCFSYQVITGHPPPGGHIYATGMCFLVRDTSARNSEGDSLTCTHTRHTHTLKRTRTHGLVHNNTYSANNKTKPYSWVDCVFVCFILTSCLCGSGLLILAPPSITEHAISSLFVTIPIRLP